MPDPGRTLSHRFDPQHNSLSILRLTLATAVALVHAQALGWGDQPSLGHTLVGDLAVDGFFVISGFLVTRSAMRLPSLRRFVWHRALRILPGFWVCLAVVAFVIAPVLAVLQDQPAASVLTGPDSATGYVMRNSALLIRQWDIAGLNTGAAEGAMDGSLWTLFYEALCYVAIGLLFAAGVLRRTPNRHGAPPTAASRGLDRAIHSLGPARGAVHKARQHTVLLMTVIVGAVHTGHVTGTLPLGSDYLARFLFVFLLGALGHIYAHRITFTGPAITWAAVSFAAALIVFEDYRPLGAPGFAYLLLWAVVALPLRWQPSADLSYGMYVYHWPLQLLLAQIGLTAAGRPVFTLASLTITAAIAYLSWRLVEAPALRQKNAAWIDSLAGDLNRRVRLAQ